MGSDPVSSKSGQSLKGAWRRRRALFFFAAHRGMLRPKIPRGGNMATVPRNRVYLVLAAALALFVFIGFTQTYYLRALFQVPPITYLLHAHALVFTAWVVLFVIQVTLISKQNYRTHMQLGVAGMIVASL